MPEPAKFSIAHAEVLRATDSWGIYSPASKEAKKLTEELLIQIAERSGVVFPTHEGFLLVKSGVKDGAAVHVELEVDPSDDKPYWGSKNGETWCLGGDTQYAAQWWNEQTRGIQPLPMKERN